MESNSRRFLEAYNKLDKGLRDIYGIKPSITFSDCIRKVATINSVIKKYEDTKQSQNNLVLNDLQEDEIKDNLEKLQNYEGETF